MTHRIEDANGYWYVADNPMLKSGVFPYAGRELPGQRPPDQIFYVYRPGEELSRPETLESANLIPFIEDHLMLGRDGVEPEKLPQQGVTGEKAVFDGLYLRNTLRIFSKDMRDLISSRGKVELSPGYRCTYEETPGIYDGITYDLIQRDILFNHLALVEKGRSGPDVSVLDSASLVFDSAENVEKQEGKQVFTKEQEEQIRAMILEAMKAKAEDEGDVKEKEAEDQENETEKAKDEEKQEVIAEPEEEKEEDPKPPKKVVDKRVKDMKGIGGKVQAVDTDAVIRQIHARDQIVERVKPFIGVFDTAEMLSAQAVAAYAVKKLGLVAAPGAELATLEGYLQAARVPQAVVADERPKVGDLVGKFWGRK